MGRAKNNQQRRFRSGPAFRNLEEPAAPQEVQTSVVEPPFEESCLEMLFDIFAKSGVSVPRLRSVSNSVLDRIRVSTRRNWNPSDLHYFDRLSHVLSLWHLLGNYVDGRTGEPKALRLHGKGSTLSQLIEQVYPGQNPGRVLKTLISVGAIRAVGTKWVPTSRSLVFRSPHVARLRILSDLAHFLETAQHNVNHPKGKLLQQTAFNPSVPLQDLAATDEEGAELAREFLIKMDALLDRRARTGRGDAAAVLGTGIGVYSYRAKGWAARTKDGAEKTRPRRSKP